MLKVMSSTSRTRSGRRGSAPLAVVAGDFGWGSVGKLRLILAELADLPTVALNSALGAGLLESSAAPDRIAVGPAEVAPVVRELGLGVALVVGEPAMANALAGAGVAVVFVDSLPFMWTEADEIADGAAIYCAQETAFVPRAAWPVLRRIRRLEWVESIVPPPRRARGGGGVVINVGGLHSPFSGASPDAYVRAVLPPVLRALAAHALPVAAVCGNLDGSHQAFLRALVPPGAQVGPLAAAQFDESLQRCDLLVTAPGSTTLLAAHFAGVPVALLPPQNLSQIMNARYFLGGDDGAALAWPAGTLDDAELERVRGRGEHAAVDYIYAAIQAAAARPSTAAALHDQAMRVLATRATPGTHLSWLGHRGAAQVAALVRRQISEVA